MAENTKIPVPDSAFDVSLNTQVDTSQLDSNIIVPGWDPEPKELTRAEEVQKAEVPIKSTIDPTAYATLIKDFNRFRAIARSESDMYDMPGHVFFRVLFHFDNGSDAWDVSPGTDDRDVVSSIENAWTGLLAPSWYEFPNNYNFNNAKSSQVAVEKLWRSSTAFNYFVLNNDIQRAKYTRQFVELLSSISANSPWYFQNIKGLDAAIERSCAAPGAEFELKTERDKITIECLDDSYDQRIGTLLDLYRSIVWSWETKRAMLPANLRKFDMTIVAFQLPLRGKHINRNEISIKNIKNELVSSNSTGKDIVDAICDKDGVTRIYVSDSKSPVASFKAWEFHGCEFDYNSSKSGWGELDNAIGSIPKYNIEIFFDDVFETRFNEFIPMTITDVIGDDMPYIFGDDLSSTKTTEWTPPKIDDPEYSKPTGWPHFQGPQSVGTNMFGATPRGKSGLIDQLVGAGTSWANTKLKKIYLGNMDGLSISKIGQQINQFLDGDLWGTVNNVTNYVRKDYDGGHAQLGSNIFPKPETRSTDHIVSLGNIFRTNTALNT